MHRYVTGMPNFTTPDKHAVELWTPRRRTVVHARRMNPKSPAVRTNRPFTVEVDGAGKPFAAHDVQFDLQVNQIPCTASSRPPLAEWNRPKLKSNYVFLKTPLGIVTVSAKPGSGTPGRGKGDVGLGPGDRHVAIDLTKTVSPPSRRFLSGHWRMKTDRPR